MSKPLAGKHVLITREAVQARPLSRLLEDKGAACSSIPMLRFEGIRNEKNKAQLKKILKESDWLFFTSVNTVRFFDAYIKDLQLPVRQKIAAVGEKTANQLRQLHYKVDFQPTIYNGRNMVEEFLSVRGKPYIGIISGEQARKDIPELLSEADVPFEKTIIYRTITDNKNTDKLMQALPLVDTIFFTSPSTVEAFEKYLPGSMLTKVKNSLATVAIGDTTAATLKNYQYQHIMYPEIFTIEHMVDRYIHYVETEEKGD